VSAMSVWAENAPGALFRSPIVLTVQWISKSAGSEDGCGPSRPDATQGCGRPFRPTARYLKSLRSPKMVSKILFCHTASDLSGGTGGMPIVLLILGAVTTAAGLVLVGTGLIPRDGTFQTEVLTPGTIAAVGGLLLIAFGIAVREMRRLERSFAVRSPSRIAHIEDAAASGFGAAAPTVSLPELNQGPPPLPVAPAPAAAEPQAEQAIIERLRAKIPTIPRVENGRLAETPNLSQALRETAGLEENVIAEVKGVAAVARAANGGAAAPVRSVPRMELKPRLAAAPDKAKASVFNAFWPATPEGRDKQPAAPLPPTAPAAPPPQEVRPASIESVQTVVAPAETHGEPVSVLKSGVVEGMAYTLYSDGSIEAQLPQGMVRFGSISALRNHIENTP
jgi:hypothetical protein